MYMKDIVVHRPQQQENPLPLALAVEEDLEEGHEIQAPYDEPGSEPPALR